VPTTKILKTLVNNLTHPLIVITEFAYLKHALELHQHPLKLRIAPRFTKPASAVNARPQNAQLATWVPVDLKQMAKELLESATRQMVYVKPASEETQFITVLKFTTTVLDSTTSATCMKMKQNT
jgi:hypothetical protein